MATPERIRRVIDQQCHRVYTLAFYTLGSHQDAEDATQEVLVRYWKHAGRVDAEKVEAWLVRVTTNVCLDLIRKRTTQREAFATEAADTALDAATSGEPDPSAGVQSREAAATLETQLAALAEPYRTLVILREVQGLSYQAISAALEMPLSSVRVYLHRGRRMLANRLSEEEPDSSSRPRKVTTQQGLPA